MPDAHAGDRLGHEAVAPPPQPVVPLRRKGDSAGAVATAGGIPPGTFRVLYASGRDWDRARRGFTRDCRFTRCDGNVKHRPGITYRLSLFSSVGGNASTRSIDESEFAGR